MSEITIVGVGALGSHLVQIIRNLDARINIIDFDRVEQRNVMSQFHGKGGKGKGKVHHLSQTMQFLWGLKVGFIPHKLTSDNDDKLLSGSDLIVDCLDNGEARRLVQNFARRTHTPCVHGALAADGNFGQVMWDDRFVIDDEDVTGAATCEAGEFLPFIVTVSSFLALSVQSFLENDKQISFNVFPTGATRV